MTGLQELYIYGIFESLTLPDLSGLTNLATLQLNPPPRTTSCRSWTSPPWRA